MINKKMQKINDNNINKNTTHSGSFFAFSKKIISCILAVCMLFTLCSCKPQNTAQSFSALYSFGEVSLTSHNLSKSEFQSLQDEIIAVANSFDGIVSLSNPESELSIVNQSEKATLSKRLELQIQKSIEYYETTYGAFNILLTPAVKAWGFLPGEDNYMQGEIPNPETLKTLAPLTDMNKITLENGVLKKPIECTIDLGGIAKGYMADLMWDIAKGYNLDGILSVAGIVIPCGDKLGKNYKIALKSPFENNYFGVISFSDKALVTSGNYERFFEVNGEKYCHIINPKTLAPTTSEVVAVSVISDNATSADVFATALMILEKEERIKLIEENNLSVLLIYEDITSETFGDFPEMK